MTNFHLRLAGTRAGPPSAVLLYERARTGARASPPSAVFFYMSGPEQVLERARARFPNAMFLYERARAGPPSAVFLYERARAGTRAGPGPLSKCYVFI